MFRAWVFAVVLTSLIPVMNPAAYAQTPQSSEKAQSLSDLERKEHLERLDSMGDEMEKKMAAWEAELNRMVEEREYQCLRAVGDETLCRCLAQDLPMALTSFSAYVAVVTQTKDDLGYESLEKEVRDVVDKVYEVRDRCVQRSLSDKK